MAELFGLDVGELEDGCVALEVLVSVKALNADGNVTLYERSSPDLNTWEAVGMAVTLADGLRASLMHNVEED